MTKEDFITNAVKIHGNKYDYSLVNYKNNHTKVEIICPIHGVFKQDYKSHIGKKYGCSKCSGIAKKTTEEFIIDAIKIHGNKYDYSLVEYKNNRKKVKIICPIHGVFEQKPNGHLNGKGCILCSGLKRKTTEEFIIDAIKIHGNKYDYSLVEYKNNRKKVKIICPIHGVFEQKPDAHLRSSNCNSCKKTYLKNEQHLYIFKDNIYDLYKIGISVDLNRRCRELNSRYYSGNKNIEIFKIFDFKGNYENDIHKKFKCYNVQHPTYKNGKKSDGRSEWFKFNDINECINYINKL